ncbi:zinc-binding dehydrogenase [Streptomyces cavernae]|uniref:zinc-binding dehydrogenase n=1 Tax=Streptomyces cavernae TaxID=2259034 RepID=UPI000FEBD815|nr:zinc-binding dehydrogenase [Streptomyces cavernae]
MYAIRQHAFGPAENLSYEQTEDPEPGPGQIRIAVAAAGVHLLDTAVREGIRGPLPALPELPAIPGREVAGTVEALGTDTPGHWLGKRVVAHLGMVPGGYAELAVTDADRLHEIPGDLDFAQAVAMVGTGRTTMGILQFAEPTPGSVVVVPAAAGGIGTLIVQYAKHAGATVIGLAGGPDKVARVASNGADLAVDYRDPDWPRKVEEYRGKATVVFDGVGGDVAREAVALLAPDGRHIVFGWSGKGLHDGAPYLVDGLSEQVLGPVMLEKTGGPDPLRTLELRALAEAAAGRLVPAVTRFPLARAAAAHRALENRETVGKVVLEP